MAKYKPNPYLRWFAVMWSAAAVSAVFTAPFAVFGRLYGLLAIPAACASAGILCLVGMVWFDAKHNGLFD